MGAEAKDQDGDTISINHRYDATKELAIYTGAGIAVVNYEVDWKSLSAKTTGNETALIYAAGASYKVSNNLALNLEYNLQNLDLSTPDLAGITQAETRISTVKLGASYSV
jgi:opacity protein-like surface antigen